MQNRYQVELKPRRGGIIVESAIIYEEPRRGGIIMMDTVTPSGFFISFKILYNNATLSGLENLMQ